MQMQLYVFPRFEYLITLTRNKIFSFRKKFQVAAILLNKKQEKKCESTSDPPRPLNNEALKIEPEPHEPVANPIIAL